MLVLQGGTVSYERGGKQRQPRVRFPPAKRDWYFVAEQPAPAPHLARPEGCAALVTVPRVSRICEHFPDGFDLHLLGEQRPPRVRVPLTHTHTQANERQQVTSPSAHRKYVKAAKIACPTYTHTHRDTGEVTQDKKMSRCHLPRVAYHLVYNVYHPVSNVYGSHKCVSNLHTHKEARETTGYEAFDTQTVRQVRFKNKMPYAVTFPFICGMNHFTSVCPACK